MANIMAKKNASLKLEIPKKVTKKNKGYYISEDDIQFIKAEAGRLGCSENDIVTALVVLYKSTL